MHRPSPISTANVRHQTQQSRGTHHDLTHVSGRFKRLVLYASQRGGATLIPYITVPVHVAASRRVPYQPQASPAWRCDSITTLPSSARVFSSVAGGAPIVPFSSSGADGVRESACHHVSPFGASIHPIIRRLTMELGGNTTKAATTHPRNLHSEVGTCRYTLLLSGACHTFLQISRQFISPTPVIISQPMLPSKCVSFAPNSPSPRVRRQAPLHTCRIG